jgi:hypothetical protein
MKSGWSFQSNQVSRFKVGARRQGDFAAQIGGFHLQPGKLVEIGARIIHMVGEHQIGLAGLHPRDQDANPERAGGNLADDAVILGRAQGPKLVLLHRAHEIIRHQDAVMQVGRLAIRIAPGGAADFDEFLDFRMRHRQIDGRRTTPQRALADGEGEGIHHPNERDNAAGLAVLAHLLANGAQIAPVAANAAALARQPHILVP